MRTGTDANNSNVRTPHGFRFSTIGVTNFAGDRYEISTMVKDVTINESIYSQTIVMEMTIVDAANFMELAKISGNEKVDVTFIRTIPERGSSDTELSKQVQEFTMELRVADVPQFAKPKPHSQVYKLQCVSEHTYLGNGTRISAAFSGTPSSIINNIMQTYMGVSATAVDTTIGNHKVIVPNKLAVDAINWIQKIGFDSGNAPLYIFETLMDGLQIRGHSQLISAEPLPTVYKHESFFTAGVDTRADYFQRQSRILAISSSLGMSNLSGIKKGSYGSTVHEVDHFAKKSRTIVYKDDRESNQMIERYKLSSPEYKYGTKNVNDLGVSNYSMITYLKDSYNGKSYSSQKADLGPRKKAIWNNLGSTTHIISLLGDPEVRPGSLIRIKLPIATDPGLDDLSLLADAKYDQYLSGTYMIVSAIHRFDELGGYYTEIKIKRDSTPTELVNV